jgi:uncharacterized protein (DUF427 family)
MNSNKNTKELFSYPPFSREPEWVPVSKRIRLRFNNETIADSLRVMMKRGFPPWYFIPRYDINMELLDKNVDESDKDKWGNIVYWHLNSSGRKTENAAWSYEKPFENAPLGVEKYIAFKWEAIDSWFEEDEEIFVHPHDPYHRIDVRKSSRHIRILLDDETVADSKSPVILFETGLPARFYLPKTDVNLNLLKPVDYQTQCPYKGTASYYSIKTGEPELENAVWTYQNPKTEVHKIKNLLAFYTEKIEDVFVDGVRLPKDELDE